MVQAGSIDESTILAEGIWRSFGSIPALSGTDFSARAGEVTGLVGPNGAGKTTLLLVLATLLAPDRGRVRIGGYDPMKDHRQVRQMLGWVPDTFGFYENLSAHEYLTFSGTARKIPTSVAKERGAELLELVHLAPFSSQPVHVLSRGQKQRLAFASALVHRPRALLLDEPAAGLDPSSRADLLRLVRQLADAGVAVVISSHQLADLEQAADRVVFVDRGTTVGDRSIRNNEPSTAPRRWRIHSLDDTNLRAALGDLGMSAANDSSGVVVLIDSDEAVADLITSLVRRGVRVISCAPLESSLEATYFELTAPQ
jgi:ABC-2 type transport system ATP-binding protein